MRSPGRYSRRSDHRHQTRRGPARAANATVGAETWRESAARTMRRQWLWPHQRKHSVVSGTRALPKCTRKVAHVDTGECSDAPRTEDSPARGRRPPWSPSRRYLPHADAGVRAKRSARQQARDTPVTAAPLWTGSASAAGSGTNSSPADPARNAHQLTSAPDNGETSRAVLRETMFERVQNASK